MSTDPTSPAGEPAAPSPSSSASQSAAQAAAHRKPLKIGSQRGGAHDARPKPPPLPAPAMSSPLLEEPSVVTTSEGAPVYSLDATRPAASAPVPVIPVPAPAAQEPTPLGPEVNARRNQRRNRDDEDEGPTSRIDEDAPFNPVRRAPAPPPRANQMTAELQAEIDAALSGTSLDQLMTNDKAQDDPELELEQKTRGVVSQVTGEFVFFQIGRRHQGVAGRKQFGDNLPEPGAMLDIVPVRFKADEGLYEVTIPGGAVAVADWSDLQEGVLVEAKITGANKGGLECEVRNIRGFIPAGQVSLFRVENLEEFVGQKMLCVVMEANADRRNLVLSRKAMLEREKAAAREKLLAEIQPGDVREGTVTRIQDFGAFVDLGGVDGLVHISKLGWDRVKHPSDVVQEGQKVSVKVEKIDPQTGKIGLSIRDTTKNPWDDVPMKYPVGGTVTGVVSRIANFGAFVKLEPGIEGLVHISEIAHHRVIKVENNLKEGQEITAKVVSFDREGQKLGLSIKAIMGAPAPKAKAAEEEADEPPRELAVKRTSTKPLKGGVNKPTGGEGIGLKW